MHANGCFTWLLIIKHNTYRVRSFTIHHQIQG